MLSEATARHRVVKGESVWRQKSRLPVAVARKSAKKRKSDGTSPRDALAGCSAGASDDAVLCPDQIKEQQNEEKMWGWHRDSFFVPGESNEGVPFQTFKKPFQQCTQKPGMYLQRFMHITVPFLFTWDETARVTCFGIFQEMSRKSSYLMFKTLLNHEHICLRKAS